MSGPVERYDSLRESNGFIFVVFYRGSWCPFCQAYLRDLQKLSSAIKAAGGFPVAITAENESLLPKMRAASGWEGEVIVDPENLLAKELKRRNLLDVAISEKAGYPHGMAQPAVLVGGQSLKGVAFKWAIVPAAMNLGGAKDRPVLPQVWDNVQAKLEGKAPVHSEPAKTGLLTGLKQQFFGK